MTGVQTCALPISVCNTDISCTRSTKNIAAHLTTDLMTGSASLYASKIILSRIIIPALAALAHPLGGGPPALGAAVGDLLFRHALTVTRPALICGSRARVDVVTAALGERTGKSTRPRRRDATAQMHDCGQVLARAEWPWIAARTLFNRLEIFRYLLLSRGFIHRVGRCVSLGWLPIPCADTDNAPYQCAH